MTWLVELTVVRLMLGLQNRVLLDVVGFFVGLGGETVLGCLEDVVTDVLDLTLVVLLQRN